MSALFPHRARRNAPLVLALAVAGGVLAGCGSLDSAKKLVAPYRHDVVQGNFVSKEQVNALRAGMSRQQARELLGTPLLTSVFHGDRWDYVFTIERRKVERQQYRLTLFFKGDALDRFEGDTMPTEAEFVAGLNPTRTRGKAPELEASEETLKKYQPAVAAPSVAAPVTLPAAASAPAPSSYPPLEAPAR